MKDEESEDVEEAAEVRSDVEEVWAVVFLPKSEPVWVGEEGGGGGAVERVGDVRGLGGVKVIHNRPQRVRAERDARGLSFPFGIK